MESTLSSQNLELKDILSYYNDMDELISKELRSYYNSQLDDEELKEIEAYFRKLFIELEYSVCFNIMSALEANFMVDYINRVKNNQQKCKLTEIFIKLHNKHNTKPPLWKIFDSWKQCYPELKKIIGNNIFKDAFEYRHWLAHGRYWEPKFTLSNYNVDILSDLFTDILKNFPFNI